MSAVEVVVVGPGAMGCLHAALLAEGGVCVGLLDHRPDRAQRINEQGIIVERDGEQRTIAVPCSADPGDFAPARLALILVKAYDTEAAAQHVRPALNEAASVLTVQNGLGNYERIARIFSESQVLAGTTTTGATLLGEGRVREAGRGFMQVGSPFGAEHRARAAVALLGRAGLDCEHTATVDEVLWAKAIVNAAINPLTALTRLRNGMLVEHEELRRVLHAVAEEAAAVARRNGVFVREDIALIVESICRRTAQNRSSMLQDVIAGRRTEIDYINGEIVRRADARGVQAPLCRMLTALIHGLEARGEEDV